MIHTADEAFLALGDYRNGAVVWRTGQFVLITEPELIPVLEQDGATALLQPVSKAAFLGRVATATKPEPAAVAEPVTAEVSGESSEPAPTEQQAAEPVANTTVADGRPRGSNRMKTGAHSQARGR